MEEEVKRQIRQRPSFEPIKQPKPDESPERDEKMSPLLKPITEEISHLKEKIKRDQAVSSI